MKRNVDSKNKELKKIIKTNNFESSRENFSKNLFTYIQNDDLEALKTLITEENFDLNITNEDNYLPIHVAAANNSVNVAEYLINFQGNIALEFKANNSQQETPLFIASKQGHLEIVGFLLRIGADIEAKTNDQFKYTPLHIAAQYGYTEIVKALLKGGANIEAETEDQSTPLYIAALRGQTETVKALLAAGANIEAEAEDQSTPLYIAALRGQTETVKALLAAGANIEVKTGDHSTSLYIAALMGQTETVKALLAAGANIEVRTEDYNKLTPLLIASAMGHADIVKALLEAGANVEAKSEDQSKATPLLIAVIMGHSNTVKVLLAWGANIEVRSEDQNKCTPLLIAAQYGHIETVKVLLAGGANIEVRTEDQTKATPFLIAAALGHTETVKALLIRGCVVPDSLKDINPEITLLIKVVRLINDILELKFIMSYEIINSNHEFAIKAFDKLMIKNGIGRDSFDDYKKAFTKTYKASMPVKLFTDLTSSIVTAEQTCNYELDEVEASLIHFMNDISPMPYKLSKHKEYGCNFNSINENATSSKTKKHNEYNEFWENPTNAKYQVTGTYLLELIEGMSSLNLPALTDMLLRAHFLDEEILCDIRERKSHINKINPLTDIKGDILGLDNNYVLPKNIKTGLKKVLELYNEYKNNPLIRTVLSHENKIEEQALKIIDQDNRISKLEKFIDGMSKHIGLNNNFTENDQHVSKEDNTDIAGEIENYSFH